MAATPPGGGMSARGRKATIGEEWWSRRFVDLLESFADPGRLARGRTYARKGRVVELNIGEHEVAARVQGSEVEPYEVRVGIDAIGDEAWEAIEAELSARAVFRAKLLAGEMPPEIEGLFEDLGAPLFPRSADDLHLMCDCLDWGDPCKHVAAVLYTLAEHFDRDPFLILAWNGRTRDRLLAGLRRRPSGPAADPEPADAPLTAAAFWTPPSGLARLRDRRTRPPVPPGLILQLTDPPPIKIRRRPLSDVLAQAYDALPDA